MSAATLIALPAVTSGGRPKNARADEGPQRVASGGGASSRSTSATAGSPSMARVISLLIALEALREVS